MSKTASPIPLNDKMHQSLRGQLPQREKYGGVSCRPTTVAAPPRHTGLLPRFQCGLDEFSNRARWRFHRQAWRAAGWADRVCARIHLPQLHRYIPGVQQWRTPVPIAAPIFMVGSERSGTTVMGKIVGWHESLLCLSEARPIWNRATPEFDESSFHWDGDRLYGRLYMDENDVAPEARSMLEEDFGRMLRFSGKPRLFEKMTLNLFRVRWLDALWPDATFIQMVRDPFSTTSSKTECWPVVDDRAKPGIAVRRRMFARLFPELEGLVESVRTPYEWYLLEWRIYTEEGERLAATFPGRYVVVRLEDAQSDPEGQIERICETAGLSFSNRLRRAYRVMLDRRIRMAQPQIDRGRCRELLGESAERRGYPI